MKVKKRTRRIIAFLMAVALTFTGISLPENTEAALATEKCNCQKTMEPDDVISGETLEHWAVEILQFS